MYHRASKGVPLPGVGATGVVNSMPRAPAGNGPRYALTEEVGEFGGPPHSSPDAS
jgi:hypothetical protein